MAARQLSALRTSVENLGFGADLATTINDWIASEWRNLCALRQWKWLEANTTFPTVVGTYQYALSSVLPNARNIQYVRLYDSSGEYWVRWKKQREILKYIQNDIPTGSYATPHFWSQQAGSILLYPIPDAIYTVSVDYVGSANTLTGDTDVPTGLPQDYDDILVWAAAMRGWARQGNWIEYGNGQAQYQVLLSKLETQDSMEQRGDDDEITTSGIWSLPGRTYWRG